MKDHSILGTSGGREATKWSQGVPPLIQDRSISVRCSFHIVVSTGLYSIDECILSETSASMSTRDESSTSGGHGDSTKVAEERAASPSATGMGAWACLKAWRMKRVPKTIFEVWMERDWCGMEQEGGRLRARVWSVTKVVKREDEWIDALYSARCVAARPGHARQLDLGRSHLDHAPDFFAFGSSLHDNEYLL